MTFKIGDVVTLKSGGIVMTVETTEADTVRCVWSEGKKQIRDTFHPDMLVEGPPQTLEALVMASMERRKEQGSN